jgi:poly(A) polymerase
MKLSLPKNVSKLCNILSEKGHVAYIAGGAVRDLLLKKKPLDFDIATDAKPEEIVKILQTNDIKAVDTNATYGTVLAIFKDEEPYEITTFRTEGTYSDGRRPDNVTFTSAEEDAKRRDFTVNALFYDPVKEEIVDFVDGKKDIKSKKLKFVGNPIERIEEDHLRILRYVRFKHTLGFKTDEEADNLVREKINLISNVSGERLRDEFNKAFSTGKPSDFIRLLDEYGLLEILLPEIKMLQGVEQGKYFHSEGDVYVHTLLGLDELGKGASLELIWAMLMHDIGKKETQDIKGEAVTFYDHEKISAKYAEDICRRFALPRKVIDRIVWAIKKHMHVHHITDMREGKQINLVQHEYFPFLFKLFKADMISSVPDDPARRKNDYEKIEYIEKLVKRESKKKYKPLITGHDLIKLGMKPGPKFKEILDEINHLQLEKKLKTKKEAIEYVKKVVK